MDSRAILDPATDYVLEAVRHVVDAFGPRPPGSDGEHQAQQFVRGELEPVTDGPVAIEAFSMAANAFFATPGITGLLLLGAILGWWLSLWFAFAMSTAAVLVMMCELGFYWQLLDLLFPKRTSHNVLGTQQPSGKVQRRLVLNAHIDAAYEWRWLYRFLPSFPEPYLFS